MKKLLFLSFITLNIFAGMSESMTDQNVDSKCFDRGFYANVQEIDQLLKSTETTYEAVKEGTTSR